MQALDIGSGYGFFTQAALKAGFQVKAINPGTWENAVFEKINGFSPIPHFFEEIEFGDEKFDLVILSQVLEHIDNPASFLYKIRLLLNVNGIVAIAVPNVDSIFVKLLRARENGCLWVPEHLSYFSKKGLATLLNKAGFVTKDHMYITRIPYSTLSKRFNLKGLPRKLMNISVKYIQKLPLKAIDFLGLGLNHNIWAQNCKLESSPHS